MANLFDDFDLDVQKTTSGYIGIEPFSARCTRTDPVTCLSCPAGASCVASCVAGCWSMEVCNR